MPQYQGIWTLAQAAQLQSTQQWATDPLYNSTTLLLQADNAANGAQNNTFRDSSSNNFTITRNGNTTQGTFTPYSLQPGAWSNFFSGSANNYLSFSFGGSGYRTLSGDFTIEAWVFWNADSGIVVGNLTAGNNQALRRLSGFNYYYNGGVDVTGKTFIPLGTWVHMAVTRSGSTVRIFTNGVLDGTVTDSASFLYQYVGALSPPNNNFSGYLSNVRVLSGTALYTANFTPSTIPLTAITNTQLLTCQSNRFIDNSTANSGSSWSVNVFGTPSVQAFSPFAPQYQYTPSVTGGSGYFDGTGDWLSIADSAQFNLGTSNYTMEFWTYPTSFSAQVVPFIYQWNNQGGTRLIIFVQNTNATYLVYFYDASNSFTTTLAVNLNAWNHIALVRNGNVFTLYINGVLAGTTTAAITYPDSPNPVYIGASYDGSTGAAHYVGYISNVRVVIGTAVYTANFTPPTAPLTAITNTQLLTNFTNAGIYDGTLKNNLETVGNAQVSTSVVKYGTGSMYFDGSGDNLYIPYSPNLNFGTGDFTVEFWILKSSGGGWIVTCGDDTSTGNWNIAFASGALFWQSVYGITNLYSRPAAAIVDGAWHHVAITRLNGVQRMFFDGVQQGATVADTNNYAVTTTARIGIGLNNFLGYIDDLRITKGIARYTANFTPPRVALPRQ